MTKFYYILHATQGDNVGEIDADSNKNALAKLKEIYAPDHPITGEPHKNIVIELISKENFSSEKTRIIEERKLEAEKVEESQE